MFIRRFFSTLVLAEHSNLKLSPLVGPALNASEYFNEEISVLVVGHNCDSVVSEVSKLKGVSKVYLASSPDLEHQQADAVARILKSLQSTHNFKRILASSSNFSRDVICRLGGALEVQPITEIIKIVNADTYKRAAYAGNAIYTVSTAQSLRLLTVRATAFDKTPASPSACPVEKLPVDGIKSLMAWIGEDIEKQTRPRSWCPGAGASRIRKDSDWPKNWETAWGLPWAPRGLQSMRTTATMNCRWGRLGKLWRQICMSPSGSRGPYSILPE